MSDDILRRVRQQKSNQTLEMATEMIIFGDKCLLMANKVLSSLGMISPDRSMHDAFNHELQREQKYDNTNPQHKTTYDFLN